MLPQIHAVTQFLRIDASNGPLGLCHQFVELIIRTDIQRSEPAEELVQILDGRVPKDLRLAIFLPGESFGEVGNEFGKLRGKGLFGQPDRFVEPGGDPGLLLLIKGR